ncbi:MAG: hypothetical protein FIB01_12830 [Gemmatimonadetes bacterium]|nr:hypothetical protein [Gemmatimonadota bacterium]
MKRAAVAIVWLFTAGGTGCATVAGGRGPDPEDQLQQGLAALAAHDYGRARPLLERTYLEHGHEPQGQAALLALAAAELDNRNPERRLGVGAELAGRYIASDSVPAWAIPAAESLFLLATELAGNDSLSAESRPAAGADLLLAAAGGGAARRPLPQSGVESVPARIQRLLAERDRERDELQKRAATAELRAATTEKELKDALAELERIRKTLKR